MTKSGIFLPVGEGLIFMSVYITAQFIYSVQPNLIFGSFGTQFEDTGVLSILLGVGCEALQYFYCKPLQCPQLCIYPQLFDLATGDKRLGIKRPGIVVLGVWAHLSNIKNSTPEVRATLLILVILI